MKTAIKPNSSYIDQNGVKIVTTDSSCVLIVDEKRHTRIGEVVEVVAYFVCAVMFSDLDRYTGGCSNSIYLFKTEKEAIEYCKNTVLTIREFHASSHDAVDRLIENNTKYKKNYMRNLIDG